MAVLQRVRPARASLPVAAVRRWTMGALGVAGLLVLPGSQALLPSAQASTVAVPGRTQSLPLHLERLWPIPATPAIAAPVVPLTSPLPAPGPAPSASPAPVVPAPGPYGVTSPSALTSSGIPAAAYRAYVHAAAQLGLEDPACGIQWSLIAGIGRVESNHGRYGGSAIGADGVVSPPILGVRLDGSRHGMARISDSDDGRYDGDTVTDRAVGPMQFLPGTWKAYGRGANPQDMNAAALAAGRYLCAGRGDLATAPGRWAAVFRYNHSDSYVSLVLSLAASYQSGNVTTFPSRPSGTPSLPANTSPGTTPGQPPAVPSTPAPSRPSPSASPSPSTTPSATPSATPSVSPTPSGLRIRPTPSPTGSRTPGPTPSAQVTTGPPSSTPSPSPTTTSGQSPTSASPSPTGSPSAPADPPPSPSDTSPTPSASESSCAPAPESQPASTPPASTPSPSATSCPPTPAD